MKLKMHMQGLYMHPQGSALAYIEQLGGRKEGSKEGRNDKGNKPREVDEKKLKKRRKGRHWREPEIRPHTIIPLNLNQYFKI